MNKNKPADSDDEGAMANVMAPVLTKLVKDIAKMKQEFARYKTSGAYRQGGGGEKDQENHSTSNHARLETVFSQIREI